MELRTVKDGNGMTFPMGRWKNEAVISFEGVGERLENFYSNFKNRETDILMPAFPKSGTHWMHHVFHKLIHKNPNFIAPEKESHFIELNKLENLNELSSPRLLNTHLHVNQLPDEALNCKKIIFLLRNPKDVGVSFFYHIKGIQMFDYANATWNGFFDILCRHGRVNNDDDDNSSLNWFHYTRQWWNYLHENRTEESFLILRYEEMLENPQELIKQLADFLAIECTKELAMAIAEATSIDKLRQDTLTSLAQLNEREAKYNFYRKGIVGDWKNHFTAEQNEKFNHLYFHEEEMEKLNLQLERFMI